MTLGRRTVRRAGWLHRVLRQRGQGLVEYGLSVSAVAFVALIGFNALGLAQQEYWGASGVAPSLARPTPAPGDFLHNTKTTLDAVCLSTSLFVVDGNAPPQINCTATVQDWYNDVNERRPPQGQVRWELDGVPVATPPCNLVQVGVDRSACSWSRTWGHTDAVPQPQHHTLVANYCTSPFVCTNPSNHQASVSTPPFAFDVVPKLDVTFSCTNHIFPQGPPSPFPPPYFAAGWQNQTEVGHPLICTPQLLDASVPGPKPPYTDPTFVSITVSTAQGKPTFSCLNGPYPDTCPAPTTSLNCSTNGSGVCPAFVYRRGYDDSLGVLGANSAANCFAFVTGGCWTDFFNVNALGQTLTPYKIAITAPVEPALQLAVGHPSGTFVQCTPAAGVTYNDGLGTAVSVRNLVMKDGAPSSRASEGWVNVAFQTAHTIDHPAGRVAVTCTAVVFDGDPSAMFDSVGCIAGGDSRICNPDDADAHPPLGRVSFEDTPSGTPYQQCLLGHGGSRPSFLGALPAAQTEYASWCQVTFNTVAGQFPAGNTLPLSGTIHARYNQETSVAGSPLEPAHTVSWSPDILLDFN